MPAMFKSPIFCRLGTAFEHDCDTVRRRYGRSLASTSAIAIITAFTLVDEAYALPAQCMPNMPVNGDTVDCIAPPNVPIDDVDITFVDDVTLNIGDANNPTIVMETSPNADGIRLSGNNSATVNIVNPATSISGTNSGVHIAVNGGVGGGVTLNAVAGTIRALNFGIVGTNAGTGDTSIDFNTVEAGTTGILASNAASANNLRISNLTAGGQIVALTGDGIEAENNGSGELSIFVSDIAAGNYGIRATNNGTDLLISTNHAVIGDIVAADTGIFANNQGSGILSIVTANVVGNTGNGIEAISGGASGNLIIDTASGSIGGGHIGINAVQNSVSDLTLDVSQVGGVNGGIVTLAKAGLTDITLTSTALVTSQSGHGIFAESTGGDITVTSDGGIVAGSQSGASINSRGGDVALDGVGGIAAAAGMAVSINSGGGDVSVTDIGAVLGDGNHGMLVDSLNGDVSIQGSGLATVQIQGASISGIAGTNGDGINVQSGTGGINIGGIASNGDIAGSNNAISATNAAGAIQDIIIDSTGGALLGGVNGIAATNNGAGSLSIVTANIAGNINDGINAQAAVGAADIVIDSSAGTVAGGVNGIAAISDGSGIVSITAADIIGGSSDGIQVQTGLNTGDITINTLAGTVGGTDSGIRIINNGAGNIRTDVLHVIGDAIGFDSDATTGNTIIAVASGGSILGQFGGALSTDATGGDITLQGAGGIAVGATFGFVARSSGGDIRVTALDGIAGQSGDAIYITSGGGRAEITDIGALAGVGANGIFVDSAGGDISIQGSGLAAVQMQGMAVSGIVGTDGDGINVQSGTGAINIGGLAANGDIAGSNDGINASNAAGATGDIVIDTAGNTVVGGENGIVAVNNGTGVLSINVADVAGLNSNGIRATSFAGGDIAITIAANSAVAGMTTGIQLETDGANSNIVNHGVILSEGLAIAGADRSIGRAIIDNSGIIVGQLGFTNIAVNYNNNGIFVATGDSDFGSQSDQFNNGGLVHTAGNVSFYSADQFTNSGGINLIDDTDILASLGGFSGGLPQVITNALAADSTLYEHLTIDGDYIGDDGLLGLDISLSGSWTGDQLIINGAATGNTQIALNLTSTEVSIGNQIVLVDADAGSQADAFSLVGSTLPQNDLVTVRLLFDAPNNDYVLASALGIQAYEINKLSEAASSLWYQSADAWDAYIDGRRLAEMKPGPKMWLQIYGADSARVESFIATTGLLSQDITLDYHQDYGGLQSGFELGIGDEVENVALGLTAGHLSSNISFDSTGNGADFDVFNLGAYVSYQNGGFYSSALVKYDFVVADMPNNGLDVFNIPSNVFADIFGVRGEVGYRWKGKNFFVEPSASLEHQTSRRGEFAQENVSLAINDMNSITFGDISIDVSDFVGLRGIAGLRIGGERDLPDGKTLNYYAGGHVVHEFENTNGFALSQGDGVMRINNFAIGTYGRFDLGLNVVSNSRFAGFLEGTVATGSAYRRMGARVGIRVAF